MWLKITVQLMLIDTHQRVKVNNSVIVHITYHLLCDKDIVYGYQ